MSSQISSIGDIFDIEDQENILADDANNSSIRESSSSKRTSWIASHFELVKVDGISKRKCVAENCNKCYAAQISHKSYKTHWLQQHPELVDTNVSSTTSEFKFHDDPSISALVNLFVRGNIPYQIISQPYFKNWAAKLNPQSNIISRQNLSDIIRSKTSDLKQKLIETLDGVQTIALTFDNWSARRGSRSYGCLTGHFISDDFEMNSLILEFEHMPYPHDLPTIANFLVDAIQGLKIEGKVIAITTDNASNNIPAIETFQNRLSLDLNSDVGFVHVRCVAHIINLAVKNALSKLDESISKVKEFVTIIKSSTARKEKFQRKQSRRYNKCLDLKDDVPTRWNSTYLMLERAYSLRESIDEAIDDFEKFPELYPIGSIKWTDIEILVDFLGPFNYLTEKLSGENYATIPLIGSHLPRIMNHLEASSTNDIIKDAANDLKTKLISYSRFTHDPIITLATILDPRIKASLIKDCDLDTTQKLLQQHVENETDLSSFRTTSDHSSAGCNVFKDIYVKNAPDEVECYLRASREVESCNPLSFWRANAEKYPKLANLARIVLPIQATSVASERAFSRAGKVDTVSRNRLSSDSFRCNLLLNSWLEYFKL